MDVNIVSVYVHPGHGKQTTTRAMMTTTTPTTNILYLIGYLSIKVLSEKGVYTKIKTGAKCVQMFVIL